MLKALLREPLVHFFLLGTAVFGAFAILDDTPPPAGEVITLSVEDARRLAAEFEATWRRPPTAKELDQLMGLFVREEVYVREALALGLDRDDAVIRRRLQTKMEFLTETGAEAVQPDDATLQAHLETNADRFREPPMVAFEQVLLADRIEVGEAGAIKARLNLGAAPGDMAQPTLLPPAFRPSPAQVVDGSFGTGFFDALGAYPVGTWSGPVETTLGLHLVRVTERIEGRLPGLDEIRARVEQDWRGAFTDRLREERFKAFLDRYEVSLPDPATVLSK